MSARKKQIEGGTLVDVVVKGFVPPPLFAIPDIDTAKADLDAIFHGFALHNVRRYYDQKFWTEESAEAKYASRVEPDIRLESVSEHSWHVADAALLLGRNFRTLDQATYLTLAVLHDKLEMLTGDFDPVGRSGTGSDTHAFSHAMELEKKEKEKESLRIYINSLPKCAREHQERMLIDYIELQSNESHFISAIDKLQALCFVVKKKRGDMSDDHIFFTLRYSRKCPKFFPALLNHYRCAVEKLLDSVCSFRSISRYELESSLFAQYEFDF